MGARIQCHTCGDIIESKHRHDFVGCTCWQVSHKKIFVGQEYKDSHGYEWTDEYRDWVKENMTGVAVDGGDDYLKLSYMDENSYTILDKLEE